MHFPNIYVWMQTKWRDSSGINIGFFAKFILGQANDFAKQSHPGEHLVQIFPSVPIVFVDENIARQKILSRDAYLRCTRQKPIFFGLLGHKIEVTHPLRAGPGVSSGTKKFYPTASTVISTKLCAPLRSLSGVAIYAGSAAHFLDGNFPFAECSEEKFRKKKEYSVLSDVSF